MPTYKHKQRPRTRTSSRKRTQIMRDAAVLCAAEEDRIQDMVLGRSRKEI